jgi:hypothetical protein
MFKLPTYDQVMKDKDAEDDTIYKGNVNIIIPGKETIEIPRRNFVKVKDSIFGKAFLKENKKELEWSNNNPAVEDLVIKLVSNKSTNFQINDFNGTISEMITIIDELKNIGIDSYFKTTTLGANWNELIKLNTFCNDILSNKESCLKSSELWVRAFNEAMKLNIFTGDFEVTNNGKIALNSKDITNRVLGGYQEFNNNKDLLINFCLYSDLYNYWDKIVSGVQWMLYQNKSIYGSVKLIEKGPICYAKQTTCCYQSTTHRHFKFNLVPYINYLLTGSQ